jgi:hypothetical protein
MLPFLSGRRQVSKYEIFVPGYTTPAQYQEACLSVIRQASWVVVNRVRADDRVVTLLFPEIKNAHPREKRSFEHALDRAFAPDTQEGPFELRRRRNDVSDIVCAGILE